MMNHQQIKIIEIWPKKNEAVDHSFLCRILQQTKMWPAKNAGFTSWIVDVAMKRMVCSYRMLISKKMRIYDWEEIVDWWLIERACVYVCVYIYIRIMCVYMCLYVCIYVCICMYICMYMYELLTRQKRVKWRL